MLHGEVDHHIVVLHIVEDLNVGFGEAGQLLFSLGHYLNGEVSLAATFGHATRSIIEVVGIPGGFSSCVFKEVLRAVEAAER